MTNEICLNIRSILMQINNAINKGFNVTVKKEAFNLLLHKGMTFFKDSQVFSLSYFKKVQFLISKQKGYRKIFLPSTSNITSQLKDYTHASSSTTLTAAGKQF